MPVNTTMTIKSTNPATLEVLSEVPVTPVPAIYEAAEAAKQAFHDWKIQSLSDRLRKIKSFHQLLLEKQDEIAQLVTLEVGKPLVESYLGELSGPLETCSWLMQEAQRILHPQGLFNANPLLFGKQHYIKYEAAGVIGIISPWNYPFSIPVMTILMALAAGNTVILKPSEKSPLTGLKIGELFQQAGFPKDTVTIITGGAEAGQALCNLDLARLIFTGSVNTGIKVMSSAASHIVPVSLELGGKDAAIVLPDAPMERTARAITWGAFTNAGQACASIERLYLVHGGNTENILKRITELASQLKIGDPLDETTEIGPLIDIEQYNHVLQQVEESVSLGAKILTGGHTDIPKDKNKLAGYYFSPTVITNVNHNMKIMREESFGPLLPVMTVNSIEEAITLANDSKYGLTASVWSANIEKARLIAEKIEAGSVYVNDCLYTHSRPELPWGGIKQSGFGRSHSHIGLLDLVNIKHVSVDSAAWHRLWWYPYGKHKLNAARHGLELLHGSFLGKTFSENKIAKLCAFIGNMCQKD